MAQTSSLNCLSCRSPYQAPHSLNASPLFTENPFFSTEKCFVASGLPKNRLLVGPKVGEGESLKARQKYWNLSAFDLHLTYFQGPHPNLLSDLLFTAFFSGRERKET